MHCFAVLFPLWGALLSFSPFFDILSRMESGGMEVEYNRQKLLSVLEKCTTSERNVLSDDRKKTPVRS